MTTFEIERRLRLPAPDEPVSLPALVLPTATVGHRGVHVRARGGGARGSFLSPRLVLAVLALLAAMVSAIASGALRLDRLTNLFAQNATFGARGISVDYPKGWEIVAAMSPFNDDGGWTVLIVSNTGVDGCSAEEVGTETMPAAVPSGDVYVVDDQTGRIYATEDRILACVIERPMIAGELRVVLAQGAPQRIGIGPFGDFAPAELYGEPGLGGFGFTMPAPEDGWTRRVDGLPAKLVVLDSSVTPGAEEVRTWMIQSPDFGLVWFVQAVLRGPDLEALRAQADSIAESLKFDVHAPPLDVATVDVVVAKAVDAADRDWREVRGTDLLGCLPRSPGSREVTVAAGPHGPLSAPAVVTCTTTVEETPLSLWHITAVVSWAGDQGVPAGELRWEFLVDANGIGTAGGSPNGSESVAFPGEAGQSPPPLDGPLEIPLGSIVQVLPPGIAQDRDPTLAVYADFEDSPFGDRFVYEAFPGQRFTVVDGPTEYLGFPWYLVQAQSSTTFGEFTWLPATDGVRPLVAVVEPRCPADATRVTDLVYLHAAERLLCLGGRELTLDPAIVAIADHVGGGPEWTPAWLTIDSTWRLFGAAGPDGVDAPMGIAIDPSLGDSLPTGTWLTVRGHFDDPAAQTCRRTLSEGWGGIPETTAMQVLQCREVFVVTSFEPRSAP
jgi:hypothetical protein